MKTCLENNCLVIFLEGRIDSSNSQDTENEIRLLLEANEDKSSCLTRKA